MLTAAIIVFFILWIVTIYFMATLSAGIERQGELLTQISTEITRASRNAEKRLKPERQMEKPDYWLDIASKNGRNAVQILETGLRRHPTDRKLLESLAEAVWKMDQSDVDPAMQRDIIIRVARQVESFLDLCSVKHTKFAGELKRKLDAKAYEMSQGILKRQKEA